MYLTTPAISVSRSGNIALYPALALGPDGRLGLAWYEYGSPQQVARSDIWFASSQGADVWTSPLNVSAGNSYNNGPSLTWSNKQGAWLCAWHSWRPPGAEPFVPGGDITNLWMAGIRLTGEVQPAQQLLPGTINTEYASIVALSDGNCGLLYHDRGADAQCLSFSSEPPFLRGMRLPEAFAAGSVADFAIDGNDTLWLVFVARQGGLFLTSRRGDNTWVPPRRLDDGCPDELTRPRISVDHDGTIWISCHSNTSGRHQVNCRASVTEAVVVHFEANGTPGNHSWTCNAISIRGAHVRRTFSFGPDVFATRKDVEPLEESNCIYQPSRGYGFNRRPASQLRELGDDLTRGLFFDSEPATFRIDVPAGEYEVEVVYSSWIAPMAGTRIRVDGSLDELPAPQRRDSIHLMRISSSGVIERRVLSENFAIDENRPSRVVIDDKGVKHLAWTRYGPKSVDVVYASFEW